MAAGSEWASQGRGPLGEPSQGETPSLEWVRKAPWGRKGWAGPKGAAPGGSSGSRISFPQTPRRSWSAQRTSRPGLPCGQGTDVWPSRGLGGGECGPRSQPGPVCNFLALGRPPWEGAPRPFRPPAPRPLRAPSRQLALRSRPQPPRSPGRKVQVSTCCGAGGRGGQEGEVTGVQGASSALSPSPPQRRSPRGWGSHPL